MTAIVDQRRRALAAPTAPPFTPLQEGRIRELIVDALDSEHMADLKVTYPLPYGVPTDRDHRRRADRLRLWMGMPKQQVEAFSRREEAAGYVPYAAGSSPLRFPDENHEEERPWRQGQDG